MPQENAETALTPAQQQLALHLLENNSLTAQYGFTLTQDQAFELTKHRHVALQDTGRFEFTESILPKIIYHFCDSAYINPAAWYETLAELQDAFYYFKNESREKWDDDDLLDCMREYFETVCQGSLEYLHDTVLDTLRCENNGTDSVLFGPKETEDEWQIAED